MSMIQRVAQIFGWVFVVIAVWGFFVSRGSMEADPAMAPRVMGLFPVNLLHNLVHLVFGIWGIAAARSIAGAKNYALSAGVIYLVLTILGFIVPTTFGLIPIGDNDIWLHALIAVVLLGAWAASRSATASPATTGAGTTTTNPGPGPETRTTTPPATGGTTTGGTTPGGSMGGSTGGAAGGGTPGGPAGGTTPGGTMGGGSGGGRPSSPPPSSGEGDRRP